MAENTKIAWCDHTINFWWGCSKVSPACANCYAEGQAARFYPGHWGQDAPRRLRVPAARLEAMRYQVCAEKEGRRFRVFTNSMSDFFEDRRDLDMARLEALDVMRKTPNLDWFNVVAFSEDGHLLARHLSSTLGFARMDIGLVEGTFFEEKNAIYHKHFPDGYELEWIERESVHALPHLGGLRA